MQPQLEPLQEEELELFKLTYGTNITRGGKIRRMRINAPIHVMIGKLLSLQPCRPGRRRILGERRCGSAWPKLATEVRQ